jgi:hypothetical protein
MQDIQYKTSEMPEHAEVHTRRYFIGGGGGGEVELHSLRSSSDVARVKDSSSTRWKQGCGVYTQNFRLRILSF